MEWIAGRLSEVLRRLVRFRRNLFEDVEQLLPDLFTDKP